MNYLKVQQGLLKNAITEKGGWSFGKYENSMGVNEGRVIWLIPQNRFVFDIEQLEKHMVRCFNTELFFRDCDYTKYDDAVITSDLKRYNNKTLVKIRVEGKEAWVDVSLLICFDSPTFKISSPTSPLMVFEKELVGMVFPFRLKEGEK